VLERKSFGIPKSKFDPANVTETVKADLRNNIKSLREIGDDKFDLIYDAALRSIYAGDDLPSLCSVLNSLDSIDEFRAEEISRSLHNKATALINIERQKRLAIREAVWRYSGAPCSPEHDATHKAENGKLYSVGTGMLINGHWTWPGREDGCNCISKPILPGIDE
jgi:hypothetical protein